VIKVPVGFYLQLLSVVSKLFVLESDLLAIIHLHQHLSQYLWLF